MKALVICAVLAGAIGLTACEDTYGYDGYRPGYSDRGYGYGYYGGDYYSDRHRWRDPRSDDDDDY